MLTSEEVTDILGLETISSPDIVEEALLERLDSYQKGATNTGTPKPVRLSYKKKLKELEAKKEAIQLFSRSLKVTDLLQKADESQKNGSTVAVKVYLDEIVKMGIETLDQETQLRFKILLAEVNAAIQKEQAVAAPILPSEVTPQPIVVEKKDEDIQKPDAKQIVEEPPQEEKVDEKQEAEKQPKTEEVVQEYSKAEDDKLAVDPLIENTPENTFEEAPTPAPIIEETKTPPSSILETTPLDEVTPTASETAEPTPDTTEIPCLTLRYKDGTRKLHIFNLSTIRLGRSTSNDFVIRVMPYGSVSKSRIYEANKLLSRYHATFELTEGKLRILDGQKNDEGNIVPSGNGVYVGGAKVDTFTFPLQEETTLTLAGLPNNPDITQWDVSAIPASGLPPEGIPENAYNVSGYYLKRSGSLHEDVLLLSGSMPLTSLDASLPEVWISKSGKGILLNDEDQTYDLKEYSEKPDLELKISSVGTLTQDLV